MGMAARKFQLSGKAESIGITIWMRTICLPRCDSCFAIVGEHSILP
jgi:hypothetical protein